MTPRTFSQRRPLAIVALLLVLLAVLATLQYRWSGEVSAMERQRMRSSLFAAGSSVADDFDREVTRIFLYFHPAMEPVSDGDKVERVVRQYDRWKAEAPYPGLIRDVFLVRPNPDGVEVLVLRPGEHRFEAVPWTAELTELARRLHERPHGPGPGHDFGMGIRVEGALPGLILPLSFVPPPGGHQPPEPRRDGPPGPRGDGPPGPPPGPPPDAPPGPRRGPRMGDQVVVRLDLRTISEEVFPALTRRYFDGSLGADYALAVVDADDPTRVVFLSDPKMPAASFGDGDLSLATLEVRPFEELRSIWNGRGPEGGPRHGGPAWPRMEGPPEGRGREHGAWRLVMKRRDGSLEQAVTAIRHRNLAISLGILTLLGATVGMMMVTTQRAQRLARQQIEFVAGVTHELNTPLTAIRSAGQNLADGVVAEPSQVRRYGALIEGEGRRLSNMVGQALEFAGIQSGRRVYHPRPVEVREIVDGAIQDCRWLLQERRIDVERDVEAGLPPLLADVTAVRQAVQNLLENAVKYGGRAGWIGVRARRAPLGQIEITVADRGPGVRTEDRPHLFEPFFRGRDAAEGTIPGSGLGLSLVRHIAEAHGGRVTVASGPGGGSAFTLQLPAAPAATEGLPAVEEPA
jgi:signal transduction histidine kinase